MIMRFRLFALALAIAGSLGAGSVAGQAYPARQLNIVVPIGTGGAPDVVARLVGAKLSENVGQPVVVVNRVGAGGIIAAESVAKSAPDGYTLLICGSPQLAINPAMYKKIPYDPIRDFAPVTLAVTGPLFLIVNAALPVNSVKDLIGYAKTNRVLYGSGGSGSVHHLGMELFRSLAGVEMEHVPYKGVTQTVPAIIAGEITAMLVALPSATPHIKAGKVRILAVSEIERTPLMPDLPTIAESGLAGYDITTEMGFVVPAGTPRDVIEKLNREILAALRAPDIAQQLVRLGINPVGSTPEYFATKIRSNMDKYAKLVKLSGARVE
jgi:tripartite-type tricarboxylate transporter receptor subunit TctC